MQKRKVNSISPCFNEDGHVTMLNQKAVSQKSVLLSLTSIMNKTSKKLTVLRWHWTLLNSTASARSSRLISTKGTQQGTNQHYQTGVGCFAFPQVPPYPINTDFQTQLPNLIPFSYISVCIDTSTAEPPRKKKKGELKGKTAATKKSTTLKLLGIFPYFPLPPNPTMWCQNYHGETYFCIKFDTNCLFCSFCNKTLTNGNILKNRVFFTEISSSLKPLERAFRSLISTQVLTRKEQVLLD